VETAGQSGPERDQEHGADSRGHDTVDRQRREGKAHADPEPDDGEPAGRATEVAGDPAPREWQDCQIAEGDESVPQDAHGSIVGKNGGRVVAGTARWSIRRQTG